MSVLIGLLADFVPWLLGGVAVLGGLFLWGRSKERQGRRNAEAEQMERAHEANEAMRKAGSIDTRDELRDELRDGKF